MSDNVSIFIFLSSTSFWYLISAFKISISPLESSTRLSKSWIGLQGPPSFSTAFLMSDSSPISFRYLSSFFCSCSTNFSLVFSFTNSSTSLLSLSNFGAVHLATQNSFRLIADNFFLTYSSWFIAGDFFLPIARGLLLKDIAQQICCEFRHFCAYQNHNETHRRHFPL